MQKIDLKLLKTALKSIAFIVGATLFLMILHFTKAFTVAPSSWRFLLLLVGFFVVHWIALLAIVTYQSDKMESSPKGKTVMWAFAIAASFFIFLVVTILMYVFSSDPDFFKIDAGNFFVGFAIIVGITALAYIIDYIVRISIRTVKYGGEMPAPAHSLDVAPGKPPRRRLMRTPRAAMRRRACPIRRPERPYRNPASPPYTSLTCWPSTKCMPTGRTRRPSRTER